EALLEELAVSRAAADAVHVVDAPDRPCVHGGIEIGELPLVRRDLSVRMLELLEKHQPELFLGVVRIDEREDDAVKSEVPRGEPRILPLVRHGGDAHRVEMPPAAIAADVALGGRGEGGIVAVEPDVDVEQIALLVPEHAGEGLALDVPL